MRRASCYVAWRRTGDRLYFAYPLPQLVEAVRVLPNVTLRGLMTVAPHLDDVEATRPFFAALRELAEAHGLPELSMGMTHDLEEGATMLRIGTAILGPRP